MAVTVSQTGTERVIGALIICGVVGVLSLLYSDAQGLERLVDGLIGAGFAAVGVASWFAIVAAFNRSRGRANDQ